MTTFPRCITVVWRLVTRADKRALKVANRSFAEATQRLKEALRKAKASGLH